MHRSPGRAAACTAAFGAALALPALARAATDKQIVVDSSLDGDVLFGTFTVKAKATLSVPPLGTGKGFLHIHASSIVIEAGAVIDASAAGFQGVTGADGAGPGGGKLGPLASDPGGGGSFFGAGGIGTTTGMGCTQLGGPGGAPYADQSKSFTFGSAGGAANVAAGMSTGGSGGGRIVLEAASIRIDGTVRADGLDGSPTDGVGAGGGAGGAIELLAVRLAGSGLVSATGGSGAKGNASSGGGGGGGLVLVLTKTTAATLRFDVAGGQSGDCKATAAESARMAGKRLDLPLPPRCIDADGDGFPSAACPGGTDCDDSDPTIFPGALEACDGVDRDCDGIPGDHLRPGACPPGDLCQAAMCVAPPDAGTGGAAARPDHVDFQGGCTVPQPPSAGSPLSAAALALAALALAARRPRGKPPH